MARSGSGGRADVDGDGIGPGSGCIEIGEAVNTACSDIRCIVPIPRPDGHQILLKGAAHSGRICELKIDPNLLR